MRQKKAQWIILLMVAVIIVAVAIFGLTRSQSGTDEHDAGEMHDHTSKPETTAGHPHDDAARHHQNKSDLSPTGRIVDGVRVIEVAARKFEFDPATIVVRQGEKIRLEVTSEDVTHGIGIEAYNIDRKLDPGKMETIEFVADKVGTFHFHCSVYCGAGHDKMHGELVVLAKSP
jgi:nitrosocyanin